MKKTLSLLLIALMAFSLIPAGAEGVVRVFNWEDYIDEEVIRLFEEETGIKVDYMRFTLNEDMMVQVRNSPGYFDVVFPSDYAIERMISEDLLQPIDFSKVPNSEQTLDWLQNPDYDPEHKYSVPYMWGTVGILYDKTRVKAPIDSWSALFDEAYKGQVFMIDSPRDALGVALIHRATPSTQEPPGDQGRCRSSDQAEGRRHRQGLSGGRDQGQDGGRRGHPGGDVVRDAQYAIDNDPDGKLAYVVPKEGSNVWIDGMVIPKEAPNPENAGLYQLPLPPDIAKMNCEYIRYSS